MNFWQMLDVQDDAAGEITGGAGMPAISSGRRQVRDNGKK
jgi:hypothetical protein